MKIRFCFFILALLFATCISAQLSGIATLANQSNHAGIKVKFIAGSGTAVTDSTTTNAAGNYSINIAGGIYSIVFSKAGYQPVNYNNNATLVLTNSNTLQPVVLSPGNVVIVSGNVSGYWTNNTIYVVNGDLTVPSGNTLTIQPGTTIKFNGNYSLTANGVIYALGNPYSKIIFTSNFQNPSPNDWKGITLNTSLSTIQYCVVEFCQQAVLTVSCSPYIAFNTIRKFSSTGIRLYMSSSMIYNNVITDFNDVPASFGVIGYLGSPHIECNTIFNGSGLGIGSQFNGVIKNNLIYNTGGYGINCGAFADSRIENNIVHDCFNGIRVGENVNPAPAPLIINNTLYNNRNGVVFDSFLGGGNITGNVIVSNTVGINQIPSSCMGCPNTPSVVSHNLVWNNSTANYDNVQILGLGVTVGTNGNGSQVDSYFNLSQDPLFLNGNPPQLSGASPCINAGNSLYSQNIGCNVSQLCSSLITGIKTETQNTGISVFPNPFVSTILIRGDHELKISEITLYDIAGRRIEIRTETKNTDLATIHTSDLLPGIYVLQITLNNGSVLSRKLIKNN